MNNFKVFYEDKKGDRQTKIINSRLVLRGMNDSSNYDNLCKFLKAKCIIKIEEIVKEEIEYED